MKNNFVSLTLYLFNAIAILFPIYSYSQDTVHGDKFSGDKVMGDKVINKTLSAPEFTIDVSERSIMSGESLKLSLHADRPKYLVGAECKWNPIPQEGLEFSLDSRGCDATLTSRVVKFTNEFMSGNRALTAKVSVDIYIDNEHFEVKGEFFVMPDLNSPEFIDHQAKSVEALIKGQLGSAENSILNIRRQMESFGTSFGRNSFLSDLSRNIGNLIECRGGVCEIELKEFCESGVKSIKWNEQGNLTNISDFCSGSDENYSRMFCLTPDLGIPNLVPGDSYKTTFIFKDGVTTDVTINVSSRHDQFDSTNIEWSKLLPKTENTPYAAIKFSENSGELSVYLASGNCDNENLQYGYDVDGKGFIDLPQIRRAGSAFNIRYPKGDVVQLRYHKNGQTFGPYTYSFNSMEFLANVARRSNMMRIQCQMNRQDEKVLCRLPKRSNPLLWSGVSEIKYGHSPSSLSNAYKVEIDKQILREKLRGKSTTLNSSFEVPKDWEDVFYVLKMKDGTQGALVRLPL